jgi:hypothetical protein
LARISTEPGQRVAHPSSDAAGAFQIELDAHAQRWLDERASGQPILITFEVAHCCGGTRVCDVRVRVGQSARKCGPLAPIGTVAGREVLLDARILKTLPRRVPITVRGLPALRHLSLDLSGEQWGLLLYS